MHAERDGDRERPGACELSLGVGTEKEKENGKRKEDDNARNRHLRKKVEADG